MDKWIMPDMEQIAREAAEDERLGRAPGFVAMTRMAPGDPAFLTIGGCRVEDLRGTWQGCVVACAEAGSGFRVSARMADTRAPAMWRFGKLTDIGIGGAGFPPSYAWPAWAAPLVEQLWERGARVRDLEARLAALRELMAPSALGPQLDEITRLLRGRQGGQG